MGISKITTDNCCHVSEENSHVSSNHSSQRDGNIGYNITIEINSYADTHCFGKNFRIVSTTEQICSVTAFLDELATMNNVPIVTTATAMVDDDGAVFIAVFGQGLFKGTNAEYKYNEEVIGDKESLVLDCIYSIDTVDAFEE